MDEIYYKEIEDKIREMEEEIRDAKDTIRFLHDIGEPVADLETGLNKVVTRLERYKEALAKREVVEEHGAG